MAGKVRAAFLELSPKQDGLVLWSRLEEFFQKLEVEPKAIKVCKFLVDEQGIINTKQLFEWLYDGMVSGVDYEEGLRLHYEVPASRWCITRDDFARFLEEVLAKHHAGRIQNRPRPQTEELNPFHDDMEIGPNMHCVNLDVIRPRTAMAGGMSWALMLNPSGLESDFFFVTHSWQEGVYEFCRKVLNHWQDEALSMWCCFLANPQTWHRQDLNQLLGNRFDLTDSPFMQALADVRLHSFVVVPNVTESLYCRLWCVAELWKAMEVQKLRGQSMIHVAKDSVKPAHKARPVETISAMIHGASCSDENDEQRIRAYIAGNELHIEDMIKDLATKTSKVSKMSKKCEKKVKRGQSGQSLKDRFGASRSRSQVQVPIQGGGAAEGAPMRHVQDVEPIEHGGLVLAEATQQTLSRYICEEDLREEVQTQEAGWCDDSETIHEDVRRVFDVTRERDEDEARRLGARHSEGRRAEELRHIALEERIKEIREKVEQQRQQESNEEKLLMLKVENLEEALEIRRRSIVERTSRERDREEALSRYLRLLEEADITDLKQEIGARRHSAMLKEEKLQQQLAGLAAEPLNEAVELEAERDQIEERLQKQITLRRQLESLEKSDGTSSVRRHLVALKQAEMAELQKEVERHRLEDEAKEKPMRHELQQLHEDWQRFRAESESRRHAFEEHEEQILSEIAMLREEAKAGKEKEEREALTPLTPLSPLSPTIFSISAAESHSSREEVHSVELDRWAPVARLRSEDRPSSPRSSSSIGSQEIERPGFASHEDSDDEEADDLLFI